MKRVRILTIHFGVNHGSVLQAYALSRYVGQLEGYEAAVIDYVPQRYRLWNSLVSRKGSQYPKGVLALYYPLYVLKNCPARQRFERFVKKTLPLTGRYNSCEDLFRNPPEGDIFLAGSDQIWNEDYNGEQEEAYYLPFVPAGARKIAYAASFGRGFPLSEAQAERLRRRLADFDGIGLREDEGVEIVKQCGCEGVQVCDPTLLLSREQWDSFASDIAPDVKYLLVYVMDYNVDALLANARILAGQAGLKICVVAFSRIHDAGIFRCYDKCSPRDFVALVRGAQAVVTNSFHGTAMALVYHKPLMILGKDRYNSRLESLLKKAGLPDRFVPYGTVIGEGEAECFLAVPRGDRQGLDAWIAGSGDWLRRQLEEGSGHG